jgi:hypothetical protein
MTTSFDPKEIERELKSKHEMAQHAFDGSQGDFDVPKSPKQMQELHDLYHRIDELESDLVEVKGMLRDATRTFAVDAPDGETDGHIQEELDEVKRIIDDAAPKHLAEVKGMLRDATRTFAVDAPDGEADGHIQEELDEVKHIIDDSAPKH